FSCEKVQAWSAQFCSSPRILTAVVPMDPVVPWAACLFGADPPSVLQAVGAALAALIRDLHTVTFEITEIECVPRVKPSGMLGMPAQSEKKKERKRPWCQQQSCVCSFEFGVSLPRPVR